MTTNHFSTPDLALLGSYAPADGLRVSRQISLEPTAWWEWQCPSCGLTADRGGTCPDCRSPLRRTQVSLPFIWIG
ncbi:MAG: hypothetical protein ACRDKW_15295 [Actinomycetota bacterium]